MLTDFGLVKAAQTSGVMLGTPSYIPPEVWGGKPTNPATDVYSLACVFFEMITGEVLFSGDSSSEVMTKHVLSGSQFPGIWPEGVPEGIIAVLHKALNRQAAQRFTNAGEFAKALGIETMLSPPSKDIVMPSPHGEREAQAPPSNLPPRSAVERGSGGEFSRKTPAWLWVLIGVVVVSVLLVVGGLLNNAFNSPRSNPTVVIAQGIGSTQVSSKDGMVMVYVPAGKFIMGSETYADEKPQRTINQEAFWIDQTEVTNAMYARCMESGTCRATGSGRTTISGYENYPVVVDNWEQAQAYCGWTGRRLPTEAEWEKAARGTNGGAYPWGEGANCGQANYGKCKGEVQPVGSYPDYASPYGALDMAGNVWEWMADVFPGTTDYMLKGGDWQTQAWGVRSAVRGGDWLTKGKLLWGGSWVKFRKYCYEDCGNRDLLGIGDNGFRCVLSP